MAGGNYRKPSLMSSLMGLNGATVGTRINVCHFFGLIPFPVKVNFLDIRLSFRNEEEEAEGRKWCNWVNSCFISLSK